MRELKSLLNPKSIAVIGASREKDKLGRMLLDNILHSGFSGNVFPVNPKAEKIGKLKSFKTVMEIETEVDLAVIAIPAKFVLEVVKQCAQKGVSSIIVITAGFSETGKSGLENEYKIKKVCEENDINLLGPNCLGIISPHNNLNATFGKSKVEKGDIAFLSQSGALGTSALDWAEQMGLGFAYFISLGNKASLNENTFLEFLNKDKKVKIIALYLEDFDNGRKFLELASKIEKPIVVLKPGKTKEAQKALGSHTGSLAQDHLIVSAALSQAGCIEVSTIEELFNFMAAFSWSNGSLQGNNIAVITNAGGPGVVTTDKIELTGLNLAELENKTIKNLGLTLPAASNLENPVDVLGDALADRYKSAIETVSQDENVNGMIVILTPQVMTEFEKTAKVIVSQKKKSDKPIVATFMGGAEVEQARKLLSNSQVPNFSFPGDAVNSLSYMWQFSKPRKVVAIKPYKQKTDEDALKNGVLDIIKAEKLLKKYDIRTLKSAYPKDVAHARRILNKIGGPVVLKIIHPKLLHKTDMSAVKLNVKTPESIEKSYRDLVTQAEKLGLDGYKIQVQPFMRDKLEVILGVKRSDDSKVLINGKEVVRKKGFGHSVIFGGGGIYAEVYRDISIGLIPLSEEYIDKMLGETKIFQILSGARGKKYDVKAVKKILLNLSKLIMDYPEISELDMNPVFVKQKDAWVADVKVIVKS